MEVDIEASRLLLWRSRDPDVDRTGFGLDCADARLPAKDRDVGNASLADFDHALQQRCVPAAIRPISRQQAQDPVQPAGEGQILIEPKCFTGSVVMARICNQCIVTSQLGIEGSFEWPNAVVRHGFLGLREADEYKPIVGTERFGHQRFRP